MLLVIHKLFEFVVDLLPTIVNAIIGELIRRFNTETTWLS